MYSIYLRIYIQNSRTKGREAGSLSGEPLCQMTRHPCLAQSTTLRTVLLQIVRAQHCNLLVEEAFKMFRQKKERGWVEGERERLRPDERSVFTKRHESTPPLPDCPTITTTTTADRPEIHAITPFPPRVHTIHTHTPLTELVAQVQLSILANHHRHHRHHHHHCHHYGPCQV